MSWMRVWTIKNDDDLYANEIGEFVERPLCKRFESEEDASDFIEKLESEFDVTESMKPKSLRVRSKSSG